MTWSNTQAARTMMVDSQVRPNKVTDPRIIAAMRQLPREAFLPGSLVDRAYTDEDVKLGDGRVLPEAMVTARMVQMAEISAGERVLVIGSGTGYTAALIAALGAKVTALEEDATLSAIAKAALHAHAPDVALVQGPLGLGWKAAAPYDCIYIEGAVEVLPHGLASQLKPNGRVVMIDRSHGRVGMASIGRASGSQLSFVAVFDCATSVLPAMQRTPEFVF